MKKSVFLVLILGLGLFEIHVSGFSSDARELSKSENSRPLQRLNDIKKKQNKPKLEENGAPPRNGSVNYGKKEKRVKKEVRGMTAQQQKEILDFHNELRQKEGASNMNILHWNEKLADLAQRWTNHCIFEHSDTEKEAASIGYNNMGQNLYSGGSPSFNVKQAVQLWYDEKPNYNYDNLTCKPGKVCGHYTAVIWADTKEVGCGLTYCRSFHIVACNYYPPGNWEKQYPFLKKVTSAACAVERSTVMILFVMVTLAHKVFF